MEKQIIKSGLKNTFFVIIAQCIGFLLGIAKSFILPIALGVTNFGYWQVYLLYFSYIGLFSLGFNDGVYLRYGKYNYEQLPKKTFRSSIRVFIVLQILIALLTSSFLLFESDPNKQIALFWVSVNIPIAGLTGVLIYILQITNQMKKYSLFSIIDKAIILILILLIYVIGLDNFLVIIVSDTLTKLFVLLLLMYTCKDIIFGEQIKFKGAYKEVLKNISVGIKLMLANICGMLVIGFGRFIVERFETVEVYGIYSFAISTTNLVLVFITAIGLVIYPTLSRVDEKRLPEFFKQINGILTIILFGLLIVYYPLNLFISNFLVDFIDIFEYLPFIFAIIFIQAKMQIEINPYYKLLREEAAMLKANLIGLVMAVLLIIPSYMLFRSVTIIAIGTFVAMGIRLYLSEIYIKKRLDLKNNLNILFELIGLAIFISLAYNDKIIIGFCGYTIFYLFYLVTKSRNISQYIRLLKSLRR